MISLRGAADDVLGEEVAATPYRKPNTVRVVFEDVVRHVGVEGLHHSQSSVAVVVDVVAWRKSEVR